MKCEAEGKIVKELGRRAGKTRDGKDWESIEYLLEESDQYHYNMKFNMASWDGPVMDAPRVGDRVKIRFTVNAGEYKGKWYNNVNAYQCERL